MTSRDARAGGAPTWAEIGRHAAEAVALATGAGVTVGTAESCTGGLVCAALTSVPGSSVAVRGGIASYAPGVKASVLGVDEALIADPALGVVCAACAAQMAEGARRVLRADVAVSVTGIAGPGGAEPGRPVGSVWLARSTRLSTRCELHRFPGDRAAVRAWATERALALLCEGIEELSSHS